MLAFFNEPSAAPFFSSRSEPLRPASAPARAPTSHAATMARAAGDECDEHRRGGGHDDDDRDRDDRVPVRRRLYLSIFQQEQQQHARPPRRGGTGSPSEALPPKA